LYALVGSKVFEHPELIRGEVIFKKGPGGKNTCATSLPARGSKPVKLVITGQHQRADILTVNRVLKVVHDLEIITDRISPENKAITIKTS
jgi:hypothetical protein